MTAYSKSVIKTYFETGDRPTQSQFGDMIDSYQDYSDVLEDISVSASAGKTGIPKIISASAATLIPSGTVGEQLLATQTTAAAQAIVGSGNIGDMTKAVYDVANISEQVIGVSAAQSQYNKTIVRPAIVGTNTNDSAAAGDVGEVISSVVAFGAGVSLVNITSKNITSISLTAGDWDVWGWAFFRPDASTTITKVSVNISQTSNTQTFDAIDRPFAQINATLTTGGRQGLTLSPGVIKLSATTPVYLVANAEFAVSGMVAEGALIARRIR